MTNGDGRSARRRRTEHPLGIGLVHVSDIHFGSGESHGPINPNSGLNVRFEDFERAFGKSVDFCIEKNIDVLLFSGDAYRSASPEPIYQKAFARQLKRLSDAGVQTVLLVGNHDQILKSTDTHAMSVFQSLEVPNLVTIDQPRLLKIDTKNGALQVIGIPYVTRHLLMTNPQYADLPAANIEKTLVKHVGDLLQYLYDQLDPSVPAVTAAHMMIEQARAGAEQELMIGYSSAFPLDMLIDDRIDYVALGHVHRHQILRSQNPAIVYAGSIERVDFSEEDEDKGFVHVQLQRGQADYTFHSIEPRPFVTVIADLRNSEDPTGLLCEKLSKQMIPGCVMRANYKIRQEQSGSIDTQRVRESVAGALMLHLKAELQSPERDFRMPQINETSALTPLTALERYLTEVAPERKDQLLRRANSLWNKLESESTN